MNDFNNSFKLKSNECYYDCEEPPEKIAFNGKCRIFVPGYMCYGVKSYRSKILNKPTYKDIFNLCDEYIKKSGNMNDYYFREIYPPENNFDNISENKNSTIDEILKSYYKPFILNPKKVYDIEMRMQGIGDAYDRYKDRLKQETPRTSEPL